MIGLMLAWGRGVEEDGEAALEWFRRAAEQGHARAQATLAAHYAKGVVVEKDLAEAYFWLSLVAERASGRRQEKAQARRLRIAKRLTSAQVEAVMERVRAWKPRSGVLATASGG